LAQDNILKIVRDVAGRVGLNKPNTVTGSTDVGVVQLLDLANAEGQDLAARYEWQILMREKVFTTIAAEDQGKLVGGTILSPADGFKKILNDTIFDRSQRVQVTGPLTPRAYQAYKGTTNMNGFYSQYRLRGGHLILYPAPSVGRTYAFEYLSENWVSNLNGDEFSARFEADEDYPLFDSQLITMGLLWRWKASKGLEYAEDFNAYEGRVLDAMAADKTTRPVRLDGCNRDGADPFILVSRGNWNL
jgi:hypothetical protein